MIERIGQSAGLVWTFEPAARGPSAYVAAPDAFVDVVVASRRGQLAVVVVGAASTTGVKPTGDVDYTIAVRLRPGALRQRFGIPASAVAEIATRLEDLVPTGALVQRLVDAPTLRDRAALLASFLRVPALDPSAERAVRAVEQLADPSLRAITRHLGMSERSVRRLFADVVGLPPSSLRAQARFRRALDGVATSHGAELAARAGYSDQAHMVRDFRRRIGSTPAALRRVWRESPPLLRPSLPSP